MRVSIPEPNDYCASDWSRFKHVTMLGRVLMFPIAIALWPFARLRLYCKLSSWMLWREHQIARRFRQEMSAEEFDTYTKRRADGCVGWLQRERGWRK